MLRKLLPYLIWAVYRVWSATWRVREVRSSAHVQAIAENRPAVFAFWHGDELALLALCLRYRTAAMVSTSRDGTMMAGVLNLMGVKTSRGSSSRGGSNALIGLVRLAREGRVPIVAVDGPRGPYHQPKPGVFELSGLLNAPVHPAGAACSRALVFRKSWNKTYVPLPFARVQYVWGDPLPAVATDADPRERALADELARRLNEAGQAAARALASR